MSPGYNRYQVLPKIKSSHSLSHSLSKLLARDLSIMPSSYGKGSWGTDLWKDLIRSIQKLIREASNCDFHTICSTMLGLVSQAPGNKEEGKARQVHSRFLKVSLEPFFLPLSEVKVLLAKGVSIWWWKSVVLPLFKNNRLPITNFALPSSQFTHPESRGLCN